MAKGVLHIGVGNACRRDDGVGPWVASFLAKAGLRARPWPTDGAGLIDLFDTERSLLLIDATRGAAPPGKVIQFDALLTPVPRPFFHNSTHEFGLAEAVELARRLGRLPAALKVVGIEGADFSHGEELTPKVQQAARAVAEDLLRAATR